MFNAAGFPLEHIAPLTHDERDERRGAYNNVEYLPARGEMMQQYADMLDAGELD